MDKRFLAIIIAIIVIFAGVVIFSNNKKEDSTLPNTTSSEDAAKVAQHTKGQGTANVTLIEYGDFQCPACEAYSMVIDKVIEHYGDKIKFGFKNYPITSAHPNAYAAARAAESAGLQGKYWEMHDLLYDQSNWLNWTTSQDPQPLFKTYAKIAGLNLDQYESDYKSKKVNDIIQADKKSGDEIGVTGTPTFYLNGEPIVGVAADPDAFYKIIDKEIEKQAKNSPEKTTQDTEQSIKE